MSMWMIRDSKTKIKKKFFTCAENEFLCDSENCIEASDTSVLPLLELDPVGESGSGPPPWKLEEEEAGLGRRKAGHMSSGKDGLREEE